MSDGDPMSDSSVQRDPIEEIAEQFLERRRRGEAVSVGEYARAFPQWAQRIRDLFPTLLLVEQLKPDTTASHVGGPKPAGHEEQFERLGDFDIVREIGRGGMGVVYEAEQRSLGRRVALKVLPAGRVGSPTRLQRFDREAQAAARLHHTNIVPIFGVGQQDGIHYYVMQFIPGQGLDRVLDALSLQARNPRAIPCASCAQAPEGEPLGAFSAADAAHLLLAGPSTADGAPLAEPKPAEPVARQAISTLSADRRYWRSVARVGVQVADALEYAHRQGTLHRDIKPANLLLDNRGTVWIADFGLAKLADFDDLTQSGDVVGTLRYMAPEQFQGKADARSDVYSLGLTLYELLVLRPAFDEKDHRRLIRQVTQEEPPRPRKLNPAVPRDLETVVVKAMASNPGHRYQTAGDLAADLRCFLEDRPIRARRITPLGRLWRWCRRNRAIAALAGTALSLLAAVAVVATIGYLHTNQALRRASEEREQAETARQQAEEERTRTKAERERAEANLRLATKAFEDIFSKVAADRTAQPMAGADDEEDEDWPEPVWETMVTGKDAALLESMLKFYDQFAQQNHADVKLQKETARAYRRVGDIQRRLGQFEKAETAYRHALAIYQRLAADSREGVDGWQAVAAIHNELGVVFRNTSRFSESRDAHLQAQATLARQSLEASALPESRFELARTYSFLSMTVPSRRPGREQTPGARRAPRPRPSRSGEAAENNRRALEILENLTEEHPDNPRYRLAKARGQRDRCVLSAFGGRGDEAKQARQEAIEILEKLVADSPHRPDYRYELAETYAMPYPRQPPGDAPGGMKEQLGRAVEIHSELARRYPTVPAYKAALARSHLRSAEVLPAATFPAQAEPHLNKAVGLHKGLVAEFPSVLGYRLFLVRSLHLLADVQRVGRQPAKARASLDEAIGHCKKMQESSPDSRHLRVTLAMQYGSLARVLRELGEDSLAEEAAAKAGQFGERLGPPAFGPFRRNREEPREQP